MDTDIVDAEEVVDPEDEFNKLLEKYYSLVATYKRLLDDVQRGIDAGDLDSDYRSKCLEIKANVLRQIVSNHFCRLWEGVLSFSASHVR